MCCEGHEVSTESVMTMDAAEKRGVSGTSQLSTATVIPGIHTLTKHQFFLNYSQLATNIWFYQSLLSIMYFR